MEAEIFKLLSGAGDLSTVLLVFMAWRFDKRLTWLEWKEKQNAARVVTANGG